MTNPYYKPRPPKPCPTCNRHFDKAKKQEVYCSMECAILPRIQQGSEDECWPWLGGLVMGYGAGTFHKRRYKVSRWMLARKLGRELEPGENALHRCDNPKCCNPAHLFPGTLADNNRDKMEKGRWKGGWPVPVGVRHGKAVLDEEKVKRIWKERHTTSQVELADEFGVTKGAIWRVMHGKSWTHVTKDLP